jgi:hypothetical protein
MVMVGACVVAGFAIPGLIAFATFTLGKAVRARTAIPRSASALAVFVLMRLKVEQSKER